jgi:hypothetical protein
MTSDFESFSGKPLAAVIDELCMGVTPRWKEFRGEIEISKAQRITCHDPEYLRFGGQVLGADRTVEEIQEEADAAAFAAVLRPLMVAVAEGRLVVFGHELPARPAAQPMPISAFIMEEPWEINVFGRVTLTTLDDDGNKVSSFRLSWLRMPSTLDQTMSGFSRAAEIERGTGKKRGRKPIWDFPAAETALLLHLENEGAPGQIPGEKAKAERFMQDWFAARNKGEHPAESTIREHVDAVISRFERARVEGR